MKCSPDLVEICVPGRCLECQGAHGAGQAAPSASATLPKLLEEPRTPQVLLLPWVLDVHVLCLLFSQRNHTGSRSSNCGLAVACPRYSLCNKKCGITPWPCVHGWGSDWGWQMCWVMHMWMCSHCCTGRS